MSEERVYCQFCRDTHPVTHLGTKEVPIPMIACPLVSPDRTYITGRGSTTVMWEDGETQNVPPGYNPTERLHLRIERPPMTEQQEEPDFAVAVRRGLARRNRPKAPGNLPPSPVRDAQEGLVRDELDRLLAEGGPRTDLPSGCGREVDAARAQLVTQGTDEANENNELTWRHLLEEDFANVLAAAGPDELMLTLVRAEARLRQWRIVTAEKVAATDPEPEEPAEEPLSEEEADELQAPHLTHFMEGDSTTPLCRFDGGDKPVRGTDRPELVTCDACKTLFEARFG